MKLYDIIQKEKTVTTNRVSPQKEDSGEELHPHKKRFPVRKSIIFFGGASILLALIYSLGNYYTYATIEVKEKTIPFSIQDAKIIISHEKEVGTERLSFQTMEITSSITRELFGSEFKEVTGKARGEVVFINEFSTTPQSIRAGTRIVGDNKKTYETVSSTTVSGYKIENKKKIAGSSAPVSIIAVETGKESNANGVVLSVNAFTGTKRKQLYARSTGALTGGEKGAMHTISDAEREQVLESLKNQLSEKLKRETRAQIPESFITFPDLQFISFNINELKLTGEDVKFPVTLKGSMVSYLLPTHLFEQKVATFVQTPEYYNRISIPEIQKFSVTPVTSIPLYTKTIPNEIVLAVTGEGTIVATIETEEIQKHLLGIRRNRFDSLIKTYPEIASAKVTVYPFWSSFFPRTEKKIRVRFK